MNYTSISDNMTDENTYLVYDENTKNGAAIDPGCGIESIMAMIEKHGVKLKYILLTHCHYDHIASLIQLKQMTGAMIVSGDRGSINLGDPYINLSEMGLGYKIEDVHSDLILRDGESLVIDGLEIKCIYTPGHTSCGVCYLADRELFCGDTLFLRSIGRTDLPTGSYEVLERSVREKLYVLEDDINLHPGHGRASSIGYEKKFNMFIKL